MKPQTVKLTFNDLLTRLKPGQAISIVNGERGLLNWFISKSQQHLLKDLKDPKLTIEDITFYSSVTHSMMVLGQSFQLLAQKDIRMAENFYPHTCNILLSEKIKTGSIVIISEIKNIKPEHRIMSIFAAMNAIEKRTPYPIWKLLYYFGWQWGWQKTFLGKPAMFVFKRGLPGKKDNDYQVCSGSVWQWLMTAMETMPISWQSAGDKLPEMWYPARLASDTKYLDQVGIYEIVS